MRPCSLAQCEVAPSGAERDDLFAWPFGCPQHLLGKEHQGQLHRQRVLTAHQPHSKLSGLVVQFLGSHWQQVAVSLGKTLDNITPASLSPTQPISQSVHTQGSVTGQGGGRGEVGKGKNGDLKHEADVDRQTLGYKGG
ncbi:hypothetical protein Q5P01_002286 [Channa striata]|uniref:Uncharacterized protein n=1 Tax=Channa striata TaxID=64152 RepID=A0AA88NT13_CHASR|nr:hypothetical protein Q5P01_002286 [Channa striata]